MSTALLDEPDVESVGDLLHRLGDVPAARVWLRPTPGLATEADVLAALEAPRKRLCELIDGVLVEKPMGAEQALLEASLIGFLHGFIRPRNLGFLTGPDGLYRLGPQRIRMPDIAFVSWDRFPGRRRTRGKVIAVSPDLAIEVLSESNTPAEMLEKRRDYFGAGVTRVWEIDPVARTVAIYATPDLPDATLTDSDTLDGAPVLPGFLLPLVELLGELDRHG